MPHSLRVVLLLILAAGASPGNGLAEDAALPDDAAVPHAGAPEDAAVPAAASKPSAFRASAMPPGEELAAAPYVYPLLRMRVTPQMR